MQQAFTVSLRVRHPQFSDEMISQSLGMKAKIAHRVGAPRATPSGDPLDGIYKETYCVFTFVDRQEGSFVDGVDELVPSMARHRDFLRSMVDTGGSSELYVGVFVDGDTVGFTLGVATMAALVDLGVRLTTEFYCD
jgi:hypothetical protein